MLPLRSLFDRSSRFTLIDLFFVIMVILLMGVVVGSIHAAIGLNALSQDLNAAYARHQAEHQQRVAAVRAQLAPLLSETGWTVVQNDGPDFTMLRLTVARTDRRVQRSFWVNERRDQIELRIPFSDWPTAVRWQHAAMDGALADPATIPASGVSLTGMAPLPEDDSARIQAVNLPQALCEGCELVSTAGGTVMTVNRETREAIVRAPLTMVAALLNALPESITHVGPR